MIKQPRDYQMKGINFFLDKKKAMNFDVPGLGKTLQAIWAAEGKYPVLIACPAYLVAQWQEVLQEQYPDGDIAACMGTKANRQDELNRRAQWTVINHEMFRTYDLAQYKYNVLIIDEAHHLRGHTAKQSKEAVKIAKSCEYVFELTATPIIRDVADLYMQLKLVDPEHFTSYNSFLNRFCQTEVTPWNVRVTGIQNEHILKKILNDLSIRRTYEDVALSIPELISNTIVINPDKEFLELYKRIKESFRLQVEGEKLDLTSASAVTHTLRQLTCNPDKVNAIKDLLEDINEDNQQSGIIFTDYIESARYLGEQLNIPHITGMMKPAARVQTAKENRWVTASIHSMSEGVDASDKKIVIFAEEDYASGNNFQALARAWRHNEELDHIPVRAYYLVIKGTIDQHIHSVAQSRDVDTRSLLRAEYDLT